MHCKQAICSHKHALRVGKQGLCILKQGPCNVKQDLCIRKQISHILKQALCVAKQGFCIPKQACCWGKQVFCTPGWWKPLVTHSMSSGRSDLFVVRIDPEAWVAPLGAACSGQRKDWHATSTSFLRVSRFGPGCNINAGIPGFAFSVIRSWTDP